MKTQFVFLPSMVALGIWLSASHASAQIAELDVTAHRGDSQHFHENSLAAFESAAAKGARSIEFDVILTADGKTVIYHDFKINPEHFTNLGKLPTLDIRELTFEQVRALQYRNCAGECRVLTLEEFFEFAAAEKTRTDLLFHLEVKRDGDDRYTPKEFARIIGEQIEKSSVKERVTVRSFDFDVVREFKNAFSHF